jgi:teichuronic acid biosynthesis glycosyltransferase TuaC
LNVLVLSHLYPHASDPRLGVFVEEEAKALSDFCQLKVMAPIPWTPPPWRTRRWGTHTSPRRHEIRQGVEVFRPQMIVLPKRILFSLLGFSYFVSVFARARELDRGFGFDLIHAHTAYPDGFAAALLGKLLHRPVVVTLHGSDVTVNLERYLWRRLSLWALSNVTRVISVSQALRKMVVDKYGADGDRLTVIPNGVDVTRFVPVPAAEARKALGMDDQGPMVLYVGAIKRSKGVAYLLRAAGRLVETHRTCPRFFFLGAGDYEREARHLSDELGLGDHVVFAGNKPNTEIPLWMNACDVLVLPSLSEGFGVVLIEAMACGKPVVSTRCGGPEEIVIPGTGILVPPRDEVALAEALDDVLTRKLALDPRTIRQHATDNYSYHNVASRIMQVYTQTLKTGERVSHPF